jgi:hypothetical protein
MKGKGKTFSENKIINPLISKDNKIGTSHGQYEIVIA